MSDKQTLPPETKELLMLLQWFVVQYIRGNPDKLHTAGIAFIGEKLNPYLDKYFPVDASKPMKEQAKITSDAMKDDILRLDKELAAFVNSAKERINPSDDDMPPPISKSFH